MSKFSFSRQPLAWLHLIALALGLAVAFGVHLTEAQIAAVMGFLQAAAAIIGWTQVTPVAAPNLPAAIPLPPGPVAVHKPARKKNP